MIPRNTAGKNYFIQPKQQVKLAESGDSLHGGNKESSKVQGNGQEKGRREKADSQKDCCEKSRAEESCDEKSRDKESRPEENCDKAETFIADRTGTRYRPLQGKEGRGIHE